MERKGTSSVLIILVLLSIGILIGVFFYIFDPLKTYFVTQDARRLSDLDTISKALGYYYRDFGRYPDYLDDKFIMKIRDAQYEWGTSWSPYLQILPKDPAFYKRYAYWVDRSNNYQSFRLYTSLDRPDEVKKSCGELGCKGVPFENMCAAYMTCNYGITSGNISP